jgi:hypothetical protein
MKYVHAAEGELKLYVVYARIKEARKALLLENGWILVQASEISKNSADYKIKEIINSVLEDKENIPRKIFLITEDKDYYKIAQQVIAKGIRLEVITGTKNPQWIRNLNLT